MSDLLIELKDVGACYDTEMVLTGVNLQIKSDDFIGVIGPNGGGKTTLLKLILGLLPPCKGTIQYCAPFENLFGYIPQKMEFDHHFPISVYEVIRSGLYSNKTLFLRNKKQFDAKIHTLLERYSLSKYASRAIGELSGGEMQRVLLCRAIISSPKLLILDEPTTYVDTTFETEFYSLIKELNKTMAIVMVSHDIGTICSYVKTIACVNRHLHYHDSNLITNQQLKGYNCPVEILSHGRVPHRVLLIHDDLNTNE